MPVLESRRKFSAFISHSNISSKINSKTNFTQGKAIHVATQTHSILVGASVRTKTCPQQSYLTSALRVKYYVQNCSTHKQKLQERKCQNSSSFQTWMKGLLEKYTRAYGAATFKRLPMHCHQHHGNSNFTQTLQCATPSW